MHGINPSIQRRRGIVGLSIFSACVLGVVGLYQTGILKKLPPHTKLFNPEAVHGSRASFSMLLKAPDAVLGMASYAVTASLAATGDVDRWRTSRVLPTAMGIKCGADTALAARLGVKQWTQFRTFSPWSLLVLAANCASLVLATKEIVAAAHTSNLASEPDELRSSR